MTLSRAHIFAKAADVAKLVLLDKRQAAHPSTRSIAVPTSNRNRNPNLNNPSHDVPSSRLPPKSTGFFRGPCDTFLSNFV